LAVTSRATTKTSAHPKHRRLPRLPFKIADKYLFGEVSGATMRGLGWFGGLLLAFAIIGAVRRVVDDSVALPGMLAIVAYSIPRIVLFTMPMSVLYGTVQAFNDLSAKGEVSALWAGGMGLIRMLRAPLVWSLILAVLAFWVQEAMVPMAEREKKNALVRYAKDALAVTQDFKWEDTYPNKNTRFVFSASRYNPKDRTLMRPMIKLFNPDGGFSKQIKAERGVWDVTSGKWQLYRAEIMMAPAGREEAFITTEQDELSLDTADGAPNPVQLMPKQLGIRENLELRNFEMVSIGDLRQYIADLKELAKATTSKRARDEQEKRIFGAIFGIHDKMATPLIVVALVLIGVPLGIRPQRSGNGFAMGVSLVVVLLYYVIWSWVSQVGKFGKFNPYVMAYLPLAVILVMAAIMVKKKA